MEKKNRGTVVIEVTFQNLGDLMRARYDTADGHAIRTVEVVDAEFDRDALTAALPLSMIRQLGLRQSGTKRLRTSTGYVERNVYAAVEMTIGGESATFEVFELPELHAHELMCWTHFQCLGYDSMV